MVILVSSKSSLYGICGASVKKVGTGSDITWTAHVGRKAS